MKVLTTILIGIFVGLIIALLLLQPKKEAEPEEMEAKIVVVDADTEEPIEGAKLKLKTTDESCEQLSLVTDENGECTFTYTDAEAVITLLRASKSGYERVEMEDYDLSNFEDEDLVIELKKEDMSDRSQRIGANGALKITLMWDDPAADLDLHIIEPNGYEIYYLDGREGHMVDNETGGELDVDWQPNIGDADNIGENAVWARPPRGTYEPFVQLYGPEDIGTVDCTVIVHQENEEDKEYTFTLTGAGSRADVPPIEVR